MHGSAVDNSNSSAAPMTGYLRMTEEPKAKTAPVRPTAGLTGAEQKIVAWADEVSRRPWRPTSQAQLGQQPA